MGSSCSTKLKIGDAELETIFKDYGTENHHNYLQTVNSFYTKRKEYDKKDQKIIKFAMSLPRIT